MDIKDFLITEEYTILHAMEVLDKVAKKVLFIIRDGKLTASITDGDIRRWILRKGTLEAKVSEIANYQPKFIYESDKDRAKHLMKQYSIEAIPVINNSHEIVSIVLWNDEEIKKQPNLNIPVVIMAGGMGTRLYPYTKILPKPLIPIGEIPIIEHIINKFNTYGVIDFYLIVNHKKNMIKAYFNEIEKKEYNIYYIDEDYPLGTGGGLSLLKGKIDSTFILSNCDILIEEDYEKIYSHHITDNNLITMVSAIKKIKIPYGVIELNEIGKIKEMKEKPELSFLTNTGVYIVEPQVIYEMENNKEIGFPEVIDKYKNKGEKVGIYPISENSWYDMGQFDEMEKMKRRLGINE